MPSKLTDQQRIVARARQSFLRHTRIDFDALECFQYLIRNLQDMIKCQYQYEKVNGPYLCGTIMTNLSTGSCDVW